jgi:hypothetical protein
MSQRNATTLATRAGGQPEITWRTVNSPRPHRGSPLERLQRLRLLRLRACTNRRVAYFSRNGVKAVQSLRGFASAKSCQPIGAAS